MNTAAFENLVEAIADQVATRLAAELQQLLSTAASEASPWLNIDSAADYLDLPKARLYKLTAQGAIPHYKQEGRLLFHRQELDDWVARYRQPGDWIFAGSRAISP
jgi:excisionase family DNA binding protein